jgi:hypothetical protein
MPTARYSLAAAADNSGRVLAMGGKDSSGHTLNTVETFFPATNTWSTDVPMPTARDSLAAATGSDGRIYAIGGKDASGTPLNTVEVCVP